MPVTMAHPLAVLPFKKTPYLLPGMVVGSMTPDLPHFVPIIWTYNTAHSFQGVFTVDILAGVVILALWQYLLFPAYDAQTPPSLRRWGAPGTPTRWWWILSAPSVFLGVFTHLVWDMFTHEWSPLLKVFPQFETQVGPYTVFLWLQYTSSLLGLALLLFILGKRWLAASPKPRAAVPDPDDQAFMWGVPALSAVIATGADLAGLYLAGEDTRRPYVESVLTTSITVFLAVALVLSVLWLVRDRAGRLQRESA